MRAFCYRESRIADLGPRPARGGYRTPRRGPWITPWRPEGPWRVRFWTGRDRNARRKSVSMETTQHSRGSDNRISRITWSSSVIRLIRLSGLSNLSIYFPSRLRPEPEPEGFQKFIFVCPVSARRRTNELRGLRRTPGFIIKTEEHSCSNEARAGSRLIADRTRRKFERSRREFGSSPSFSSL